ncbi:hypothetical protein HELRODRAFT_164960 [Helobdella robusta]|uniref:Endonuclease/exonuclease/phosphatase domain-containing protein n=1 Tax=Helobdella robusta TaxID=6412 RepID=T1EW05_HELRO|nr:hypothetical protein HELRODRAFT_164960 [Helobdella robusta]ESN92829.1 hypothetical protein HELRODRAFT_164960 [Helobdella robusta]
MNIFEKENGRYLRGFFKTKVNILISDVKLMQKSILDTNTKLDINYEGEKRKNYVILYNLDEKLLEEIADIDLESEVVEVSRNAMVIKTFLYLACGLLFIYLRSKVDCHICHHEVPHISHDVIVEKIGSKSKRIVLEELEKTGHGEKNERKNVRMRLKIQNGPSVVLRLETLNVGSLTGRSMEIAEMLERRKIDICCLQETRWKSNSVCHISSDKEKYRLFWNGQKTAKNGVGIFVREPIAQEAISMATLERKQMVLTTYMAVLAMENGMKMATASLSLLKVTGFVY